MSFSSFFTNSTLLALILMLSFTMAYDNDYIFLNQLELKTDTSLLKSKFKANMAEFKEFKTVQHNQVNL